MEENYPREQSNRQKKYRQKQNTKGMARFEIQIPVETKVRFDELVEAIADEYVQPFDIRRRIALARVQVFENITKGISHDFFHLKDRIESLREEIKALSPSFFKTETNKTPLPEAINALPDDSKILKALLARLYQETQASKLAVVEYKRRAKQFEDLYQASDRYNDELKQRLEPMNGEF